MSHAHRVDGYLRNRIVAGRTVLLRVQGPYTSCKWGDHLFAAANSVSAINPEHVESICVGTAGLVVRLNTHNVCKEFIGRVRLDTRLVYIEVR